VRVADTIPRLFHWVWLGPHPLPEQYRVWQQGWLDLHPGWDHILWTDDNLPSLTNAAELSRASSYAQQADIVRYEAVYQSGGVYLDCDMECLRNIESTIAGLGAFAAWFEPQEIGNTVFGATPAHPWLGAVIGRLPQAMATGFDIVHQTGPGLFTTISRRRQDVVILPRDVFYGEPGDPDPLSVHHCAKSWHSQQEAEHADRYARVATLIEHHVPPAETFMRVEDDILPYTSRRSISLLWNDGEWLDHPADDAEALRRVSLLLDGGVRYAAFIGPSRWWLDHYAALAGAMREHCALVATRELVLIDLCEPAEAESGSARW
jgi:hypothetical protein